MTAKTPQNTFLAKFEIFKTGFIGEIALCYMCYTQSSKCRRKSKTKFKKTARQLFRSNVALANKKGFIGKAFDLLGGEQKYT